MYCTALHLTLQFVAYMRVENVMANNYVQNNRKINDILNSNKNVFRSQIHN